MKKTSHRLADGREIIYYDLAAGRRRGRRATPSTSAPCRPSGAHSEIRHDPLLDDGSASPAHRNARTYHPPADECPLCPSREGRLSEIPESDYEVAVFENRFPSFRRAPGKEATDGSRGPLPARARRRPLRGRLLHLRPPGLLRRPHRGAGPPRPGRLDRPHRGPVPATRGGAGVLLREPRRGDRGHPRPPARPDLRAIPSPPPAPTGCCARRRNGPGPGGRNLFDDVRRRANWPPASGSCSRASTGSPSSRTPRTGPTRCTCTPSRRVPDLLGLEEAARAEFPGIYLELLRRFDRIFGEGEPPTPYIAAWHQAPFVRGRPGRGGLRAAPGAFHHPPYFRQAEVPRGLRVRHERVHQRRAAGGRGRSDCER